MLSALVEAVVLIHSVIQWAKDLLCAKPYGFPVLLAHACPSNPQLPSALEDQRYLGEEVEAYFFMPPVLICWVAGKAFNFYDCQTSNFHEY